MNYEFSKHWRAGLTGRYESKRFRLDDDGIAPGGVSEDRNVPIYGTVSYSFYPGGSVSAIFGYNIDGKLSIDNESGNNVYKTAYESSLSLGLIAHFRF